MVQGAWFRVHGSWFKVQGSGFRRSERDLGAKGVFSASKRSSRWLTILRSAGFVDHCHVTHMTRPPNSPACLDTWCRVIA